MNMLLRCELAFLFAVALAALSAADPMMLLMNAQAKCISVEVPADSLLTVDYEAPDLVLPEDMKHEQGNKNYNPRRFRTTIIISQTGGRDNRHGRAQNRKNKPEKVVKDLETKKGSVEYETKYDGTVNICVQSVAATSANPTPISLRVSESPAGDDSVGKTPSDKKSPGEELDSESQRNAKEHFSQMEKTLSGLIKKTDMILRQADYAKELEVEFHEQSIAMHKASQWWPILQLCVLLVTGFTQANHMVQFFRKHHIF